MAVADRVKFTDVTAPYVGQAYMRNVATFRTWLLIT